MEQCESKSQNLETENKLLKDQLKKYVSAVQLIRNSNGSGSPILAHMGPQVSGLGSLGQDVAMATRNDSLQRDYSYEAEQYEKKLIQVKRDV